LSFIILFIRLLQDNPADFSYFFDTSRRRTCYIAPERFVESSWRTVDPTKDVGNLDLTASEVKTGDLTPSMDIFSAGYGPSSSQFDVVYECHSVPYFIPV
jgi:hypothetical protein